MSESSGLPVFITKNGYADGVFFSMGAFAKFEKEIMARRIKEDLEAMCKGEGMNADDLIRSLKEEYGI